MNNHITTYTGLHFEPSNPDPDRICIEDIAHALSMICRGNGHVRLFWSVGQHCICCAREAEARGLSNRLILACLLHDASECYLSDIPTPFKRELPAYQDHEERLMDMVYEKYLGSTLTPEEHAQMKEIDRIMLWYDLHQLLASKESDEDSLAAEEQHPMGDQKIPSDEKQPGEGPGLHIKLDRTFRPFEDVEKEYLQLFYRYHSALD